MTHEGLAPDAGETLLESLIALTMLAIAVAAVLAGVAASSVLTGAHRDATVADAALKAAAEHLKAAGWSAAGAYSIPPTEVPSGFTSVVTHVHCWQPGTSKVSYDLSNVGDFAACTSSYDKKLQIITVRTSKSDGSWSETTVVTKRAR